MTGSELEAAMVRLTTRSVREPARRPCLGCTIRSTAIGKSILRCRGSGNREEKSTPAPRCALDPDASAVSLDDALGDGKPEPGALTPSPGCLPKSVKDTGQVLGRDATARIRNPEDDLVIPRGRAHRDTTASLRELDRVADEVLEHLKEPVPITPDLGNIRVHVDSKLKRRRRCERSLHLHRLDDQLTCRQSRSLDGQLPCLHERDIQEILNQAVHARGCAVDDLHRLLRSPFGLWALTL